MKQKEIQPTGQVSRNCQSQIAYSPIPDASSNSLGQPLALSLPSLEIHPLANLLQSSGGIRSFRLQMIQKTSHVCGIIIRAITIEISVEGGGLIESFTGIAGV